MSRATLNLNADLRQYLLDVSVDEPGILKRLREETLSDPKASMQVSPEQGQFMAFLVRMLRVETALEIGVYTGYSSLCVALAMPHEGRLLACDLHRGWTDIAQRYWKEAGVDRKITLRLGPAINTLEELLATGKAGTFDFVFIDADKESYPEYFDRAYGLIKAGGVIAIDNTLWSGKVVDPTVTDEETVAIRDFNAKLKNDRRVHISMIPIGDGLTLALKL